MRRLNPGDITRKLAQIEHSGRSRRWKRRAKAQLLNDVGAEQVPNTDHYQTPTGRICAKRRYPTFSTAYQALIDTWNSPSPRRHEKRVHPCSHCNGWHLTSRDFYGDSPYGNAEKTDHERDTARQGEGSRHRDPTGPREAPGP